MGQLIQELKRRNVIRVAVAYAVAAWILIEVTSTIFPILSLPTWSVTLVTVFLLIGFPLVLVFSWAYEITPEGIKKEKDVERSELITRETAKKLDIAVIVLLLSRLPVSKWRQDYFSGRDANLMNKNHLSLLLPLVLLLAGMQVSAQDNNAPAADAVVIPADEFDRGTPRRSAEGLLAALDKADYETASEYLDLRNLRGEASGLTGAQLARRLYVIVKRATWVDVDDLVDDPAGRSNDNLPDYRDSIGVVPEGDKEIRLLMQKVPRGDGVFIWKVSNATVSLIPVLYATYGYPEVIEDLRRSLPNVTFLGYELFKWVIVLGVGVFVYTAVFLIALAIRRVLGDPDTPSHRRVYRFLILPVGIWMIIVSMNTVATSLGRGITAEAFQQLSPVPLLVTVWLMFSGMNLMRDIYSTRLQQRDRSGAAVLLRPASNAIKLLIGIGATLIYLDQLGVNITTVLAGLGVGGIAVALALQKPMEDVFGAITLYTQQPVRVGDFCRIGTEMGTIEEIGLRTTRLRTLANTLIAIPNSRLANEPIRQYFRAQEDLVPADLAVEI
ncbi:MAG: mechanosensitive ion channel [Proteobacteria bacterium]|nr:mechanosensitive ion channel [Pseudomonadota bacterium]